GAHLRAVSPRCRGREHRRLRTGIESRARTRALARGRPASAAVGRRMDRVRGAFSRRPGVDPTSGKAVMNARIASIVGITLLAQGMTWAEGTFDRLRERLEFGSHDGWFRARLSGSLELEAYAIQHPVSDLVFSARDFINPRLVLSLDAQLGDSIYVFGQARLDRRFDPTDAGPLRPRLDELAVRRSPG